MSVAITAVVYLTKMTFHFDTMYHFVDSGSVDVFQSIKLLSEFEDGKDSAQWTITVFCSAAGKQCSISQLEQLHSDVWMTQQCKCASEALTV